jgi:hypothetical protein
VTAADEAATRLRAFLDAYQPDTRWIAMPHPGDPGLTLDDVRAVLDEREQPRASVALGATDDGRLRLVCPACDWDAVYPSLDLLTAAEIAREHVANHVPLCECGCVPGQPCGCGLEDCECVGGCPVCDAPEDGDVVIGAGSEATSRMPRCPNCGARKPDWNPVDVQCENCASQPEPCDGDCDCDCQPGQPCLCPERDCYCGPCPVCGPDPAGYGAGTGIATCGCGCQPDDDCTCGFACPRCSPDCPVCDLDVPDDDAGHGDAITHRNEGTT